MCVCVLGEDSVHYNSIELCASQLNKTQETVTDSLSPEERGEVGERGRGGGRCLQNSIIITLLALGFGYPGLHTPGRVLEVKSREYGEAKCMGIGDLGTLRWSLWQSPKMRAQELGWRRQPLTLSIQAYGTAAGSLPLAFKGLPYSSGAASVYEQIWRFLVCQQCQGRKAYHSCLCPFGPLVLLPVFPEVFFFFFIIPPGPPLHSSSASSDVWPETPFSDLYFDSDRKN